MGSLSGVSTILVGNVADITDVPRLWSSLGIQHRKQNGARRSQKRIDGLSVLARFPSVVALWSIYRISEVGVFE